MYHSRFLSSIIIILLHAVSKAESESFFQTPLCGKLAFVRRSSLHVRGGAFSRNCWATRDGTDNRTEPYGRIGEDDYRLTPEQIATFHREGCVTIENVLTDAEVNELADVFDLFMMGIIPVPAKDFCDMSKPFGISPSAWSIVNCMLPTTYYPPWRNNIYERVTRRLAQQLFPHSNMVKDYDQLLNKRPGKSDAVFAWHQDMAYWPGPRALGVNTTDTCTFSLAIDDSDAQNGCLRYVAGSGVDKQLRPHRPLVGHSRETSHALTVNVNEEQEDVRLAPAKRGSLTIHDEYVVHGSGGNSCPYRQRRTYVLAYRANTIVEAERKIGFTHSHNDQVNWDNFRDGEKHRLLVNGTDDDDDSLASNSVNTSASNSNSSTHNATFTNNESKHSDDTLKIPSKTKVSKDTKSSSERTSSLVEE